MSVRFLGRRVYLSLVMVLMSVKQGGPKSSQAKLTGTLAIPAQTLLRWRRWWADIFPMTPFWQANCARFMPPVTSTELPASLIERFTGPAAEALMRLLAFLSPLTVRQ